MLKDAAEAEDGHPWPSFPFPKERLALIPHVKRKPRCRRLGSRQAETRRSLEAGLGSASPFPTHKPDMQFLIFFLYLASIYLVGTSCLSALNTKRCGQIRAYGECASVSVDCHFAAEITTSTNTFSPRFATPIVARAGRWFGGSHFSQPSFIPLFCEKSEM